MKLADNMHFYSDRMEDLIRGPSMMSEYDKESIVKYLGLLQPENVNIYFISKSVGPKCNIDLPYYSSKYGKESLSEDLLKRMANPTAKELKSKMDYPPPNNYVPSNFDLVPIDEARTKEPTNIQSNEWGDVWFKQDAIFKKPKSHIFCKLFTGDCGIGSSAQGRAFFEIWESLMNEIMREENYMADMVNLRASLGVYYDNLQVQFQGWNHTLPNLVSSVFDMILGVDW